MNKPFKTISDPTRAIANYHVALTNLKTILKEKMIMHVFVRHHKDQSNALLNQIADICIALNIKPKTAQDCMAVYFNELKGMAKLTKSEEANKVYLESVNEKELAQKTEHQIFINEQIAINFLRKSNPKAGTLRDIEALRIKDGMTASEAKTKRLQEHRQYQQGRRRV